MPEYAMWALIVSLAIYSLGVTYKLAFLSESLKLVNKVVDGFVEQINSIRQEQEKTIMSHSDLSKAKTEEIIIEYETQISILKNKMVELKKPKTISSLAEYAEYMKNNKNS
jgi:phosphoribosyl-dephospho-CoA transferase